MITFKTLRRIIACLSFWALTLMFLDFTGTLHAWFSWLAKIQFWPAVYAVNIAVVVVLVLLTLLLGRIYCSIICPLGIMQDGVSWLHKKLGKQKYSYSKGKTKLREAFLLLFLFFCVCGIPVGASLLEPYSVFGRFVTTLAKPIYMLANNGLATIAERADSYMFYSREIIATSTVLIAVVAVHLVIICILAWRGGRTYCNTVCPVGSILGFLSRFSVVSISLDADKCKNCGKCAKTCKASCIDLKEKKIDYSRCVMCGDCLEECSFGSLSLSYKHLSNKKPIDNLKEEVIISQQKEPATIARGSAAGQPDTSRRSFLIGAALATSAAAFADEKIKMDGGLAEIEDKIAPERKTKLTPAGSLSAQHFAQHCTACQLCVSECPNDVLRPQTSLENFMQPTMSYERGYCRPECTRCADVCPTGAIQKIEKAEKTAIKIGTAIWIKKNCLPLTDGVSCGNCARHCPAGAIEMIPEHEPKDGENPRDIPQIPAINESLCIGCGACENLCPARPFSAIVVEGCEVHQEI